MPNSAQTSQGGEGEYHMLVQVLIDNMFIFSTKCSFKVGQTFLIVTQKEGIL